MSKILKYRKCDFCNQELKAWNETRPDARGKLFDSIVYNHKNPNYSHVTPFNTMKCYNKKDSRHNRHK